MSRSVLSQLSRDSIEEVLRAENTIDKASLKEKYPLLCENVATEVKIFIDNEVRGRYSIDEQNTLIENIIIASKRAAFECENFAPLTTSEYLSCEIEITLKSSDGIITNKDEPILKDEKNEKNI